MKIKKGNGGRMYYLMVGIICFIGGSLSSFLCICLCMSAKRDDEEQETDPCDGCFGAANNDCWQCPVKNKER